jgi:phosphoribosyl-AMP cyclohydrolase
MIDVGPSAPGPSGGARSENDPGALSPTPDLSGIKFDSRGLVPCIVQEWGTGEVLMLAYMSEESLHRTFETGTTWFYSRSRAELWNKGATSGHFQRVRELRYDCDGDTLLALVEQTGAACHTGDFTCFDGRWLSSPAGERPPFLSRPER